MMMLALAVTLASQLSWPPLPTVSGVFRNAKRVCRVDLDCQEPYVWRTDNSILVFRGKFIAVAATEIDVLSGKVKQLPNLVRAMSKGHPEFHCPLFKSVSPNGDLIAWRQYPAPSWQVFDLRSNTALAPILDPPEEPVLKTNPFDAGFTPDVRAVSWNQQGDSIRVLGNVGQDMAVMTAGVNPRSIKVRIVYSRSWRSFGLSGGAGGLKLLGESRDGQLMITHSPQDNGPPVRIRSIPRMLDPEVAPPETIVPSPGLGRFQEIRLSPKGDKLIWLLDNSGKSQNGKSKYVYEFWTTGLRGENAILIGRFEQPAIDQNSGFYQPYLFSVSPSGSKIAFVSNGSLYTSDIPSPIGKLVEGPRTPSDKR